jgi:hypothetical protein
MKIAIAIKHQINDCLKHIFYPYTLNKTIENKIEYQML